MSPRLASSSGRSLAPRVALVLGAVLAIAACDDDAPPPPPPNRGAQAAFSAALSASAAPSATGPVFTEADFTVSDGNRDPFKSNLDLFRKDIGKTTVTRTQVLADRFSLDELKLVALVTGGTNPRAMFVDSTGKGWIVTTGQLIGRAEVVKSGGSNGAEYELNWKVDRIREKDVVFVRENPGRPGTTGVFESKCHSNLARLH